MAPHTLVRKSRDNAAPPSNGNETSTTNNSNTKSEPEAQSNHGTENKTAGSRTLDSPYTKRNTHAVDDAARATATDPYEDLLIEEDDDEIEHDSEIHIKATLNDDESGTATSPPSRFMGGYNAMKTFNGQVYTGMAVGGSHTWNYDAGVWKETKLEPDLWKIDFETAKRRWKNAPKGSGAPEGMEYHWLIVAHQYVKKTDANTYSTHLVGSKYKLAHKGPSAPSWSVPTVKAQREREMELLDDAKRRVQGLPPVVAGEKVKVETKEKGQQKLDSLFAKTPPRKVGNETSPATLKRKREGNEGGEKDGDKENLGPMARFVKRSE